MSTTEFMDAHSAVAEIVERGAAVAHDAQWAGHPGLHAARFACKALHLNETGDATIPLRADKEGSLCQKVMEGHILPLRRRGNSRENSNDAVTPALQEQFLDESVHKERPFLTIPGAFARLAIPS